LRNFCRDGSRTPQANLMVIIAITASGDMLIVPDRFPIALENRCIGGLGIAGGPYSATLAEAGR
jgi:uncharacterized protein GlcG (DUF336 family)